jgi:WD40 repeat protein
VALAGAALSAGCAGAPRRVLDVKVDGGSEVRWLAGDSLLAVALLGRGVAIVDAATGEERAAWRSPTLPSHTAHGLAVSAAGETLAVATEDSVRLVRSRDAALLFAAPGGGQSLALAGDGRTLAWSDGTFGRVLDTHDGHVCWQGQMLAGRNALAWSPASGAYAWTDTHLVLFLGPDSTLAGELGPFMDARPTQLVFSASGRTLAVAESTKYISFWDARNRRMRWRLQLTGRAQFERMAVSADTWYLATAHEGRARLLWAYTGHKVADWLPHSGAAVRDMAFSHDGRRLATVGADGHLCVWTVPPPRQQLR